MNKILNETQLKVIKLIGDIGNEMMFSGQGVSSNILGFYWNEIFIVQPFLDDVGDEEVDPIEFYGETFLNSDFVKKVKNIKQSVKTDKDDNKLSETQLDVIKLIGEIQCDVFYETVSIKGMVSFEYDDITIINPFLDYSGDHKVEPIEYYGEAFLNSKFVELVKDF